MVKSNIIDAFFSLNIATSSWPWKDASTVLFDKLQKFRIAEGEFDHRPRNDLDMVSKVMASSVRPLRPHTIIPLAPHVHKLITFLITQRH